MSNVTIAIAGLGSRGRQAYGAYILQKGLKVAAAAEPIEDRRREAAEVFGIPEECCFQNADELLKQKKLADILFVCTPDENHYDTAIKALKKGYHLLLEKPIAVTAEECITIARTAKEYRRHVVVCHVLRYSPFYGIMKAVIASGEIGRVININAVENVGYYHYAHSYIRGKWRRTEEACPMILAKSCHDIDILLFLTGGHIKSLSSYGELSYFKPENAPEGAAERCLGNCLHKKACPYDAEKIYISNPASGVLHGNTGWPADVLAKPATEQTILEALKTGAYGRCVYHCDNDVVDHQVVNMEFTDGMTAHLTMSAFSPEIYRTIQIMGTLGQLEGDMRTNLIKKTIFGQEACEIDAALGGGLSGHGGGDARMFDELIKMISGRTDSALSAIEHSLESHIACFLAEQSRQNGGLPQNMDSLNFSI